MSENKNTLQRILSLLKQNKILVALSLVFSLIIIALSLYIPILIGDAIDKIIGEGNVDFKSISSIILLVAVSIIITAVLQWIMNFVNNKITFTN